MNIFETTNYKSKPAIKIERKHLNELKRGEYCEFAEYLKLPPLEENLILEMLPEDIFLYIFKYLSPGDLIRVASTCKALKELSQDTNAWRIITYNYNQFLILKEIEFEKRDNVYQENKIPIYGIIEKLESLINNNIDNDKKSNLVHPKQKLSETKPNLSSFFRRRRNEDPFIISLEENKIERNLIRYIEKIPNPQKEIISKAKLIYNSILERKQRIDNNIKIREKQEEENKRRREKEEMIEKMKIPLLGNLIFLFVALFTFVILINVYIDKHLSSNILYFFIPLFIATFSFSFSLFFFIWLKISMQFKVLLSSIGMIILFIELLLIGLRIETTIKGSWLLIFIPFFIFIGFIIVYFIIIISKKDEFYLFEIGLLITSVLFLIFLILLGLRLDETIKSSYGIIFIPFFLIDLLLFLIIVLIPYNFSDWDSDYVLAFKIFSPLTVLIPTFVFKIILIAFIEGTISTFGEVFSPFYVGWSILTIAIIGFFGACEDCDNRDYGGCSCNGCICI